MKTFQTSSMSFQFVLHQEKHVSLILGWAIQKLTSTLLYTTFILRNPHPKSGNDVRKPITLCGKLKQHCFSPHDVVKREKYVHQSDNNLQRHRPITSGPVITSMRRAVDERAPPPFAGRRCFSVETVPGCGRIHVAREGAV